MLKKQHLLSLVALALACGSAPRLLASTHVGPDAAQVQPGVRLADADADADKDKKKKVRGKSTKEPKGMKAKHLTGEATLKGKDQSKIDFDAADIGGERKTPLGTLINQNKADKNYDFVKIRLRWHPEMVQSASSLDTGAASRQ